MLMSRLSDAEQHFEEPVALERYPLDVQSHCMQIAEESTTAARGNLHLSFNILRLVLDELADRFAKEAQLLSESEKKNMVEFASEFQQLCAKSGAANESSNLVAKKMRADVDLVGKQVVSQDPVRNQVVSLDDPRLQLDASIGEKGCADMATTSAIEKHTSESRSSEASAERPPNTSKREDLQEDILVTLFRKLDADNSESLSADELRRGLTEAGVPLARCSALIRLADVDNSDEIELKEWMKVVKSHSATDATKFAYILQKKYSEASLFQDKDHPNRCVFHPTGITHTAMDITIFVICCYLGVISPLVAAWEKDISTGALAAFDFIDRITMFVFVAEIILNFLTGYFDRDYELVLDHTRIAKHYLRTWFPLDFICVFPFEFIGLERGEHMQIFKVLKLVKILKLVKMMAPHQVDWVEYSDTLENLSNSKVPQLMFRGASIFLHLILVCHWMACGMKVFEDQHTGWLVSYVDGDIGQEYLASLYWAMTTLTTVGFGDICPTSDVERAYTIASMVMGGAFYGYVVGCICSMVSNFDLNREAFYERMGLIHEWVKHHKLPPRIQRRIRRHFKLSLSEKAAISDSEVWRQLTPEIQREVGQYIIPQHVIANPIFDGISIGTVVRLLTVLQKVSAPRERILAEQGEAGTAMYILIRGSVQLVFVGACNKQTRKKLGVAQSFGEEILLGLAENYDYTATTLEETTMQIISEDDFLHIFSNMPHVIQRMRQNAIEMCPQWGQALRS